MRKFRIPISIYGTDVIVLVVEDLQQAANYINKRHSVNLTGFEDAWAFCIYGSNAGGGRQHYMALTPDARPDVIVHECVHITTYVLDHRGIAWGENKDEPHAYLTQFLFREISKKMQALTEREKKGRTV